ncbi:glycosyltransferase [Candidatus Williamhamiltonella defendens]|uniref:glycosyltransferase n=1 Tax=Candidatus Williamhamiltonella defendens TaxID=138072 RepID=UPI001582FF46|nr:glycosyltransferase [Candidatus Hamiltonella defensa]
MNKKNSITLYCNWNVYVDDNGDIWLTSADAQYIRALKNLGFFKISLISKVSKNKNLCHDYCILKKSLVLIPIPFFNSYFKSIFKLPAILKAFFTAACMKSDYLYIRVYEPFIYLLVPLFKILSINTIRCMHYVAEPKSSIFYNSSSLYIVKILRYLLFLPDYYLTNIVSLFCHITSNGPIPMKSTPFFVRNRMREIIESSILETNLKFISPKNRISGSIVRILYVGYIRPSKGMDTLINAVNELHHKDGITNFTVTIVGNGEYLDKVKKEINDKKIAHYFSFPGYIPFSSILFEYYYNADIFVNVSPSETGPRVLLEAGIFNCYLISTKVGYSSRIINNNNGILIDINNLEQLRIALINSIKNIDDIRNNSFLYEENKKLKEYSTENFFRLVFNFEKNDR